jgi:hypothetical protein
MSGVIKQEMQQEVSHHSPLLLDDTNKEGGQINKAAGKQR